MDRSSDREVDEFLAALSQELAGPSDELSARRHVTAAAAVVRSIRLRQRRARRLIRKVSVAAAAFSMLSTGGLAVAGVLPAPLQHAVARAADAISLPISVPYPDVPEAATTTAPIVEEPAPRPNASTTTTTVPTTTEPAGVGGPTENSPTENSPTEDSRGANDGDSDRDQREGGGSEDSRDRGDDPDREWGDRDERRRGDEADRDERRRGDDPEHDEDEGESSRERSENDGDGSTGRSGHGHP